MFLVLSGMILVSGVFFMSCSHRSSQGMMVVTQVPGEQNITEFKASNDPRKLSGAQLRLIDPKDPTGDSKMLTGDFFSACSPDVSFDGTNMIFTGQKTRQDLWQIYQMDLGTLKYKALTIGTQSCIDPIYLPGDRIMYKKVGLGPGTAEDQALFVYALKEDQEQQITYGPGTYAATSMLQDGRIITLSRQMNNEASEPRLMVMRPDGTKQQLFYQNKDELTLLTRAGEQSNGKIYLIEQNKTRAGELFSVAYSNPLHSKKRVSEHGEGDFIGLSKMENGRLLVCFKPSQAESYGVFEIDPEGTYELSSIFDDKLNSSIQAVAVEQRKIPKNIPSEVDIEEQTALLLCQDVNFMGYDKDTLLTASNKVVKLEVLGTEASLGMVDVEKDGSVYLKIKADTPFRLQTLNENGEIINGPSSWINMRPNERRACVGCHQGNEVAPNNKQPLAVLKEPIVIPAAAELLARRE